MNTLKPIKELACISLAIIAFSGSVYAVEPLTDTELGEAVVLDPFGATAAGQIDTTLSAQEEIAINADEANQNLATDPNSKQTVGTTQNHNFAIGEQLPSHYVKTFSDGIQIQTQGSVQRVHVDALVDNTGANRGSQTYQNLYIDNMTVIREYR